jgi:hypothetical protein
MGTNMIVLTQHCFGPESIGFAAALPEPASIILLLVGLLFLLIIRRRRHSHEKHK